MTSSLPGYQATADAMRTIKAITEPSEAHAILCGLLTIGGDFRFEAWLNSIVSVEISREESEIQTAVDVLKQMYHAVYTQIENSEYELIILLPEGSSLYARLSALAMWTQAYVSSLELRGISVSNVQDANAREALEDLMKMGNLQYEYDSEESEENEFALVELIEYVKVAALLVHHYFQVKVRH